MLYLLNSPILTDYGVYSYRKITVREAKKIIERNPTYQSAIGHEGTAILLQNLLSVPVPVQRTMIHQTTEDIAIVFRVLTRLPEGAVLSEEEIKKIPFELGVLIKLRNANEKAENNEAKIYSSDEINALPS
ncbi:DUF1874 domain-containing protein [Mycobacterium sp.]|uniref:STIV orfB116 family protein n=1 Tax=Mycobacterium sp. TaxID=1785 RepID=UPI0031D57984